MVVFVGGGGGGVALTRGVCIHIRVLFGYTHV